MHKKDWQLDHLKSLNEERERNSDACSSDQDDLLTISTDAATNQVKHTKSESQSNSSSRNNRQQSHASRRSDVKRETSSTSSPSSSTSRRSSARSSAPAVAADSVPSRRSRPISLSRSMRRSSAAPPVIADTPETPTRSTRRTPSRNTTPVSRTASKSSPQKSSNRPSVRTMTAVTTSPAPLTPSSSAESEASPSSRPVRSASRRVVSYEDEPEYMDGFVDEEQEVSQGSLPESFRRRAGSRSVRRPRPRAGTGQQPSSPVSSSPPRKTLRSSSCTPVKSQGSPSRDAGKAVSLLSPNNSSSSQNGKSRSGSAVVANGVASLTPASASSVKRSLRRRGNR